jgi:hypothetical protein
MDLRRISSFLCCALLMVVLSLGVLPRSAAADFPERPVAFVVLDQEGNVDAKIHRSWQQVVKWAYHFPYYQFVDEVEAYKTVSEAVRGGAKLDKVTCAELAQACKADVLVIARVYELDEVMVSGWGFRRDFESYVRVAACADLLVYKQDGDKFLQKKLRERQLRESGNVEHPEEIVKWQLSKLVNTMEGRSII